MSKAIICGTDMHDNSLVCRVAVGKEEAKTKRYGNTDSGRKHLFGDLKGMSMKHGGGRIIVAYEASTHGFCLYDDCRDVGIECYILAPTKMRKSKKEQKKKTDESDAQLILETIKGHILAGNELPSIWIPDDKTRADRETVRARLDLGTKLTTVKTQVQTLLKAHRMKKPADVNKAWTKPYRKWLMSLSMDWPALATLVRQIENLEREIMILDLDIKKLSEIERYAIPSKALVENIKGVGLLTAMVYLTEMGDLSRFSSRQKTGAFLGLAPSSHESGEADDRKGHITREGSFRVRRVLCQATWSHVTHGGVETQLYNRIVKRNPKHKKIAVVAVMRRLGIRMWHIGLNAQKSANVFNDVEKKVEVKKVA